MTSPPLQSNQQQQCYARFIAVFAVYGTGAPNAGAPAQLKLVIDSFYQSINANVNSYRQATPVAQ
jgi:hypothetical protein